MMLGEGREDICRTGPLSKEQIVAGHWVMFGPFSATDNICKQPTQAETALTSLLLTSFTSGDWRRPAGGAIGPDNLAHYTGCMTVGQWAVEILNTGAASKVTIHERNLIPLAFQSCSGLSNWVFFLSCWPRKYRITKILNTGNICLVWKEMTNVGMRGKKSLSDIQPEHSTTIHHGERDRIGQNLQHWQHTLPALLLYSDREYLVEWNSGNTNWLNNVPRDSVYTKYTAFPTQEDWA